MAERIEIERDERGRFKKVTKAESMPKPVEIIGGSLRKSVTIMDKRRTGQVKR